MEQFLKAAVEKIKIRKSLTRYDPASKIFFVRFPGIWGWPLGQVVKTPPSHGGYRGSNPLGVTICWSSSVGRAADL